MLALMEPCELFDAKSLRSAMKVYIKNINKHDIPCLYHNLPCRVQALMKQFL